MGGKPISQVQFCIDQLLANQNPNLNISIVKYQSTHEIIHIPRGIKQSVPLGVYGGTSFKAAFDGIIKVLVHHAADALITSADVVFLTDGQDGANPQARQTQMTEFRASIQRVWGGRPITIHTVGFGTSHDFAFLNQIRVLGSEEGAYRFADPAENDDVLSQKINGVLAAVCQKSSLPITGLVLPAGLEVINSDDMTSGGHGGGIYWVNMSRFQPLELATEPLRFQLAGQEGHEHQSLITLSGKYTPGLDEEWFGYLSDKLAAELTGIPPKSSATDGNSPAHKLREIQIRIIRHRISVLGRQLSTTSYDTLKSRVAKLLSVLDDLSAGQTINARDMSDLKFGGRFKDGNGAGGLDTGARKAIIPPTHSIGHSIMNNSNLRGSTYDKRWDGLPSATTVRKAARIAATSWNNWHLVAHGRLRAFEALDSNRQETLKNQQLIVDGKPQLTALGVSIATGNWKMTELIAKIFKVQSVLEIDDTLETACLIAAEEGYSQTLDLVVNRMKLWQPEKALIDSAYGKASRALRTVMSDAEINPHSAVINGETDTCGRYIKLVSEGRQIPLGKLDWRPLLPYLIKPTTQQIMCVGLLIRAGLLDTEAEISLDVSDDNGTRPEILWPAFIASERGLGGLFSLLVKSGALSRPEQINKQNLAGTSLLWIAACNRHIDLVCELIKLGADVNLANAKGNPPLIPCCQKGSKDIVRILLDSGARLDVFNTNRDGAVLICCRNGQSGILDMLLAHLPDDSARQQQLSAYAEIDGFTPLFAAIELDKVDAADTCLKYGADLHWRTLPNNPVIPGATALHLACYYGRTRSVKFLMEKGLNPEAPIQAPGTQHDGTNALHLAIKGGFLDIAQMIVALPNSVGARCLTHTDAQGRTPEYYSNMSGNEHIKRELFTNHLAQLMGGMLQICGSSGESDKLALTEGCASMLGQLVSPGLISPTEITNIRNDKGMTLLAAAIISGNTGIARELVKMGADPNAPDDYGITPTFWAELFGCRDVMLGSQPQVSEQLDRISAAKKKSIQNKMLLELTEGFSSADFGLSDPTNSNTNLHVDLSGADMLIDRWMLGWGISPESARAAQDSLTMAQEMGMEFSLLGFLDKLQNKSVFPGGKQQIRQILWDARVHITKLIASGATSANLEPIHMMALYLYTANPLIYKQVNELLVAWDDNNVWAPFVHALYQGCHKLIPAQTIGQEVYRWVDIKFSSADFPIGSEVEWPGFTVCSAGHQSATTCLSRTGICFIIQDTTGKSADISKFSKYPQNQEVVFLPGTRFKVIRYLVANPICLAQANIRDTTFKMTDIEMAKAESGRVPVIVELEVC
jgi:ankyrin repeat protein